jgi:hypothetical protein
LICAQVFKVLACNGNFLHVTPFKLALVQIEWEFTFRTKGTDIGITPYSRIGPRCTSYE